MWEKHFVSIVTLHVYIPIIGMILTNTSLEYILTVREVSSINDERKVLEFGDGGLFGIESCLIDNSGEFSVKMAYVLFDMLLVRQNSRGEVEYGIGRWKWKSF
ncbi:transmembrane protein, putative [Medicago truncatula]|uniref:Transmembrane protein, putative n=1 Tax=Medicago truncatula TaxID=3880 RepID=A0A072TX03_MEDTR|nr:transmembrane protein, putative [Medicago truncatula]